MSPAKPSPRPWLNRLVPGICLVVFVTAAPPLAAQQNTTPAEAPATPWQPPPPPLDKFDWIQIKSDEWLKGKVKSFQNRELEFDSEELEYQTFDWEDVKQLRAVRAFCLFENNKTMFGTVQVDKESVTVTTASGEVVRLPRSELRGISPGEPKEINYWSGKESLGINLRSGNTGQADIVANFKVQRRTPNTKLLLEYLGNWSKLEGVENVNNHRVTSSYDVFLTDRIFVQPVYIEYYRDPFQNIAHRATASVGAGYYIFDRHDLEWVVSGGPGYQYTHFDTVETDEAPDNSTPSAVLKTSYEQDLTKRIDLNLSYQGTITSREAGTMTHHAVNTLEIELTRVLDFDISLIWDRTENPQPGSDGVVPKNDDFRLNLALGIDF